MLDRKNLLIVGMAFVLLNGVLYANNGQVGVQKQAQTTIKYQEPTTGVEIIFSKDAKSWDKIMANGESELMIGDSRDIRQATSKAIIRAKAEIAKFLKEKVKTSETIEEITKTLSTAKSGKNTSSLKAERKTVETLVTNISNSADAILKGVIVLEQEINRKEKFIHIKVGMSRKTMKTADNMSNAIKQDLSKQEENNNGQIQNNNQDNEIRRSKNYNNF